MRERLVATSLNGEGKVAPMAFRDNLAKLRSLAGDKGYCLGDLPQKVLDLGIKPHLAVPDNAPARSPARRFVGSKGYKVSQVIRKRVEEIFGWGKSVAGLRRTKLKGRRRTWDGSYLIMAAYNLTRMIRLLRPATA